jgi:hypothetical protein
MSICRHKNFALRAHCGRAAGKAFSILSWKPPDGGNYHGEGPQINPFASRGKSALMEFNT